MSRDDRLVKKARKGEQEAFGKLYDEHLSAIYRFVFIRVQHRSDAEDITQQVFLSAWQSIRQYSPRSGVPFSSWLYKIAKNAVYDHYRTQKEHIDIEDIAEKTLVETPDQGRQLDDSRTFQEVKQALGKLTDDEQDVLIMKFIDEMTNKEIAEILDKSEGAVRVAQHRGLKKLKKELTNGSR